MITADQLVAHAIGDYVLQSDWMATKKRTENVAAGVHAIVYSLPFLLFSSSTLAIVVIATSHFVIDRHGLARYLVWAKNFLAPRWIGTSMLGVKPSAGSVRFIAGDTSVRIVRRHNLPWRECVATGYPPDRPPFLAVWLLIIADNLLHVLINGLALRFL